MKYLSINYPHKTVANTTFLKHEHNLQMFTAKFNHNNSTCARLLNSAKIILFQPYYQTRMYPERGALIVLEGADRSGKSTQCKMLVESLKKQNIEAELLVFPDRTTAIGKVISQYLSNGECKLHDKAIHMLFSANRWESYEKIVSKLQSGVSLVVDRYSYSGIAYSASKLGMDIEWCKTQEIGLPKPDLVCMLTVNEEQLAKRPGFGNERYENKEMQSKVSKIFKELADSSWEFVDASGTIEEVQQVLLNKILNIINDVKGKKIQPLQFKKDCLKENVNCYN